MSFKRIFKVFIVTNLLLFCLSFQALCSNDVSIDFDDVDIKVFIKFISEVTGKNFIIDNRVKGKINVVSPGKISPEKAYKVFESVLDVHGYAAVKSGDVIKVVSTFEARTKNMKTIKGKDIAGNNDTMVTQVIPLDYSDPRNIKRLIAPLVSKRSAVMSYQESSMIIITDYQSNINRLLKIIDAVDVQETGREISIIPLENADAQELSKTLKQVFPSKQKADEKVTINSVRFVPDERTNILIAVAGKLDLDRIKSLVHYLDKEKPKGDEKFHVYYLENADSEKLSEVLQNITSGKSASKADKGKKVAPLVSGDVYITADKSTNSLIIKASKSDYEIIKRIIEKLDVSRQMIYLECLVAEMNTEDGYGIGAEWALGYDQDIKGNSGAYGGGFSGNQTSPYSTIGGVAKTGAFPSGFSVGVLAETLKIGDVAFPNLGAVINAYKNDKNVNILSTPQITTLDNEKAKIYVGKNIPYLIKASSGDSEYSNYEYKDVGLTLEITPQISQDGLVKLKIFQEVTRLDSAAGQYGELPTTLKRTIDTTVTVENKNTLVLGGLIDESFSESANKVPCLGDIPILGYLFKTYGEAKEKTNLFVFVTPHVINSKESADSVFNEKKEYINKSIKENLKGEGKDIPLYE